MANKLLKGSPKLHLGDLLDDVLLEILHRLPCKDAFRCKCVSKHWFYLISGADFYHCFISRQCHLLQPCSLVADMFNLFIIPKVPSETNTLDLPYLEKTLSFSFLPNHEFKLKPIGCEGGKVLGFSNGLLLCRTCRWDTPHLYYICNIVSKQWIRLPKGGGHDYPHVGFICDTQYPMQEEQQRVGLARPKTKFFVVLLSDIISFMVKMDIFSSETGWWRTLETTCSSYSKGFNWRYSTSLGVAYNGMLYFLGRKGLLVYDPFNDLSIYHIVDDPICNDQPVKLNSERCLGVSCGSLRMCQAYYLGSSSIIVNVNVWELKHFDKETGAGSWHFVHNICLEPDIWNNFKVPRLFRLLSQLSPTDVKPVPIEPLALDPLNRDILYFKYLINHVFSCNLHTKKLEIVHVSGKGRSYIHSKSTIPILLPWWPTPLPSLKG